MKIYQNRFHDGHVYLSIDDFEVDKIQSSEFEKVMYEYQKPLQVMVKSSNRQLVQLLNKSGFQLKRRCYEVEVSESDLITLATQLHIIFKSVKGSEEYFECAKDMFLYYKKTHALVNPLTASLEEFMDVLPVDVVYFKEINKIEAAAFIENNEIAYIYANNTDSFEKFAGALINYLFGLNKTIYFEADDTDWVATKLRNKFLVENKESYDTYIKAT